ncbi:hypothetical protein MKW98_005418 [Papaver atlanticum]|uniref:RHOMBOID-like protein n=1 Tax=Papaver atlanticum TaxID=357466 RepID=A0AAD4RWR7_9MAGN|nr:hypothetical protein MKW98_005418 [Papaver atlanticum]
MGAVAGGEEKDIGAQIAPSVSSNLKKFKTVLLDVFAILHRENLNDQCSWCHFVNCIPSRRCSCNVKALLSCEFAVRIRIIYLCAGFTGSLMSALFVQDIPEVGSSGALFGLLGEMLSGLIRNWKIYRDKFTSLVVLCGVIGILMVEIKDPLIMPEVYSIIKGTIRSNAEWVHHMPTLTEETQSKNHREGRDGME